MEETVSSATFFFKDSLTGSFMEENPRDFREALGKLLGRNLGICTKSRSSGGITFINQSTSESASSSACRRTSWSRSCCRPTPRPDRRSATIPSADQLRSGAKLATTSPPPTQPPDADQPPSLPSWPAAPRWPSAPRAHAPRSCSARSCSRWRWRIPRHGATATPAAAATGTATPATTATIVTS